MQQGGSYSDICTVAAEWRECAAVTVNVPANKTYRVMIDSAGSFNGGGSANRVRICSSARNSATPFDGTAALAAGCVNTPTGVTLPANEIESAATNGVQTLAGGGSGASYIVSTAVRPDATLVFDAFDFAVIHTLVTVSDATTGGPTGAKSAKLKR